MCYVLRSCFCLCTLNLGLPSMPTLYKRCLDLRRLCQQRVTNHDAYCDFYHVFNEVPHGTDSNTQIELIQHPKPLSLLAPGGYGTPSVLVLIFDPNGPTPVSAQG